jgi:hypothetical protein
LFARLLLPSFVVVATALYPDFGEPDHVISRPLSASLAVDWLKRNASDILPLAIAVIVPLAGLLLAVQEHIAGDRTNALRIGAACVLGVCLWAIVLTA